MPLSAVADDAELEQWAKLGVSYKLQVDAALAAKKLLFLRLSRGINVRKHTFSIAGAWLTIFIL